jgi:hypothetical protein
VSPSGAQDEIACDDLLCRRVRFDTSMVKVYCISYRITSNAASRYNIFETPTFKLNATCGAEVQSLAQANLTVVYDRSNDAQNTTAIINHEVLQPVFKTDIAVCSISRLTMYDDYNGTKPWTRLDVQMAQNADISITTTSSFRTTAYVFSFVDGK